MRPLIISMAVLALSIFGNNEVQLKNTEPLIDLASSVVDSEAGKGGNEEAGLEKLDEPKQVIEEPKEVEIVISVRDREIRLNGEVCTGTDRLADRIKNLYKTGMIIRLVDDYGEYHTYKEVREKLEELKYSYKEEASQ